MEYYVGLDVSLRQTSICVVSEMGSVVREGVVDSDPEAIAAFVRSRAPAAVRVEDQAGSREPSPWPLQKPRSCNWPLAPAHSARSAK